MTTLQFWIEMVKSILPFHSAASLGQAPVLWVMWPTWIVMALMSFGLNW